MVSEKFFSNIHGKATDLFEALPESVQKELTNNFLEGLYRVKGSLEVCESPIEQLLIIRLMTGLESEIIDYSKIDRSARYEIIPQKQVEIRNKKFRIDIAVCIFFNEKEHWFAIECDGHNFHEKTKKQAANDRSRERMIMELGYTLIRFTGSEIYSSPLNCAAQAMEIMHKETGFDEAMKYMVENQYREFPDVKDFMNSEQRE